MTKTLFATTAVITKQEAIEASFWLVGSKFNPNR
jgi:hypothetical protein